MLCVCPHVWDVQLFTQGDAICVVFKESDWMKNRIFRPAELQLTQNPH